MFRVYWREGTDARMREYLATSHPVEAESQYLKLVRDIRTDGPGVIILDSKVEAVVPQAEFRTDRGYSLDRELVPERHRQIWATPDAGFVGPTPFQVRAVSEALGGRMGSEIARRIGKKPLHWRYWTSTEDPQRIPFAVWFSILVLFGFHPVFSAK